MIHDRLNSRTINRIFEQRSIQTFDDDIVLDGYVAGKDNLRNRLVIAQNSTVQTIRIEPPTDLTL